MDNYFIKKWVSDVNRYAEAFNYGCIASVSARKLKTVGQKQTDGLHEMNSTTEKELKKCSVYTYLCAQTQTVQSSRE
jgi:hypothetical protein